MRLRNDRKAQRIKEGQLRNLAWSQLTLKEKIASLLRRRGASKRQLKALRKEASSDR